MKESTLMDSPAMIEIPEKAYFKIGEVAKLLDVEPYVLRYWETEFDELDPEKTKSGQRVYQRIDIELLFQIRALLYEEMFTIAGARRQLERSRSGELSYFDLGSSAVDSPSLPSIEGSAVAEKDELLTELTQTRRELIEAQTFLEDLRENVLAERARTAEVENSLESVTLELRRAREESQIEVDHGLVEELQAEVLDLQSALVKVREEAEEDRLSMRRGFGEREQRRQTFLAGLRREVEALAALAEPGRNRA